MKKIIKFIVRVVALALALILAYTAVPYVRDWAERALFKAGFTRSASVLAHEVEKLGEMTSLRMRDDGVMDASVDALLVGKVASVKVRYRYEIGFGVDLTAAIVTETDKGAIVELPRVKMLYDSFTAQNEPEIQDFFSLVTKQKYQEMLNEQALACREKYTLDKDILEQALQAAVIAVDRLCREWSSADFECTVVGISE